ncbi:hypothetical protein [Candidatus Pelagibacter sp. HIMB1542]|uniref:hypothetical protein n=1 Tax=Candidatus Pelagibacter sp. HIMB1542 TaxID=3413346 RepID=UPI003F84B159
MKIHFYGLLHIADNDININFKPKSNDEKVRVYIKNSELLAKSLLHDNINYTLLTNNEKELNRIYKSPILNIKEINFKTKIIKGSHFYPCYYRIDVFNFLSKQKNQFSFLIDLDVVLIRSVIKKIQKLARKKNVLVNDITDLILPAYGFDRINFEFSLLKNKKWKKKWYGADFIAGSNLFFENLYQSIKPIYKKFQENFNELKNQGDELFLSSAIEEVICKDKFNFIDARSKKIIARYWSVPRKHYQESFEKLFQNNMVHFLADKKFLANYENDNFSREKFIKDYKNYNFSLTKIFKNIFSLIYNKYIKFNKMYY